MKKKKKVILAVVIVLAIAIVGGTIFYVRNRDKTVVKVYSMEMLNSSDWFADDSELTGTLSSDYIQEVTVDSDKKVKKIYVKKGDKVKKGDILLKYNMEEEELELKLQKLQIKSSKLEIEEMEKELETLKNTTPVSSSADAGSSSVLKASADLSGIKGTALSYLVAEASSESGSTAASEATTGTGGSENTTEEENGGSESTTEKENGGSESTTEKESESTTSTTKTKKSIRFKQKRTTVQAGKIYRFSVVDEDGNSINQKKVQWTLGDNISKDTFLMGKTNGTEVYGTEDGVEIYIDGGEPSATLTLTAQAESISGISSESVTKTLTVKGADTGSDDDDSNSSSDSSSDSSTSGTSSSDDGEETYTKEELEEAISEKEEEIAEAKEELHEAKISYKEAKAEVSDATVKATINGTVTSASDKGTLPTDGSAAIVVKAAEGMYVKTTVSELTLDTIKVGGTITCTSMETGDSYEAEVLEVSDFPSESESDSGISNPNSSYYPVVAFISDADDLSTGDTVEITYSSESMGTSGDDTIYIQKAYVRTEDGRSYVYKRNKETKRLEKQYVKTGETMYGQYIEIKSGLSTEDYIAFPYGKTLKEGVKTKISEDDSDLIY